MYVEVFEKMGRGSNRDNAVPAPTSTATTSSFASVSVGTMTPFLTFTPAFLLLL